MFGLTAYLTSGLAFLGLSILLATSWRGRIQGGLLLFATATTAAWSLLVAYDAVNPLPLPWLFLAESARNVAWLTFLAGVIRQSGSGTVTRTLRYAVYGLWAAVIVSFAALTELSRRGLSPESGTQTFVVTALLLVLGGLVLVEQMYRNAPDRQRWALKYLCLGVGGLFAYDLFLYAHSLLFRQIAANLWDGRGIAVALVVPLIAVAARRNPQWSLDVFVSRQIVFYTTSVVGVGLYLITMALGGYYLRIYGGEWGLAAQFVFLLLAVVVLLTLLFSEPLKARIKVFLSKHFYTNKYDYREEWLRLIKTMSDSEGTKSLPDRAIHGVAQIVDSAEGGLWVRREESHYVPVGGSLGTSDENVLAADEPVCRFLAERQWIIDLSELETRPEHYEHLALPAWLSNSEHGWLIVPLILEGALYGFIVLGSPRVRRELSWEDHDLLKTVGRQVATYLALDEAGRKLTEAGQFEAFNRLTAFIMHDLKNLISQQSLVVRNAARHKDNPRFIEDAIKTVENSVQRMNHLLRQLQRGNMDASPRSTDLGSICDEILQQCDHRLPVPQLLTRDDALEIWVNPDRLSQVLIHLIKNAQEATDEKGWVRVTLSRIHRDAVVEIADNGVGMDAAFVRNRLFRPFDSTKGQKGMGIGADHAKEYVRLAGGRISVDSNPGSGTVVTLVLPLSESTRAEQRQQAGAGA